MNIFNISSILMMATSASLAIFIFIKNQNKESNYVWGFFCLIATIWGFAGFMFSKEPTVNNVFMWWQIAYICVILSPVMYSHFVISYLKLSEKKLFIIIVYIIAFIFLILNFFFKNLFLGDIRFVFGQFYWHDWTKNNNIAFLLFYIVFYWFLLNYSFLLLLKRFIHSIGLERQQLKYLIFGSLIGWLGPHGFFPIDFGFDIYPFSNFFLVLYPLIFAYAIIKYRLMDISMVFTRAGIFVIVYSFVLGIPFALSYGCQSQLKLFWGDNWWLTPLISMTVLATAGPFLYLYINKKAEAALLKEQRSYQNILRNASNGMIRIRKLDRLLNVIAHVVTKAVKLSHASIFLLNKELEAYTLRAERGIRNALIENVKIDFGSPLIWWLTHKKDPIVAEEAILRLNQDSQNIALSGLVKQLAALKASLVIPSFVEDRLIGILILGEKRSRKLYSQDDIAVFSVLANQAALAIENAQFYDEIKQTHEQLFQAEKLATIGTMADGLSHQINNRFHALSLIAGDSLDMLKTFDLSACTDEAKQVLADLRGALERIESNVLQGGEVVKGLLKYSRPGDSGHEAVDFKDVVNGAIDMVQYKIKIKEIDLVQEIPQNMPRIHANLIQLQEVFFNLIDNAYDAIKERQLTLKEEGYRGKIEIKVQPSDGVLEIIVSDNGMGIKDLDRKKLFTPFFTTKATAKKGTGLGLYVIEKIISAHNGKISIDSTYLFGTRFNINLPIFKSAVK